MIKSVEKIIDCQSKDSQINKTRTHVRIRKSDTSKKSKQLEVENAQKAHKKHKNPKGQSR